MAFNLSLTPPQVEFVLKPGVTLTQAYQVTNESDQKITLNTQILPFLPSGDNGSVTYHNLISNPHLSFSLNNADLTLGQPFTLGPQETRQIVLKITASPQAQLSDYYATFFLYQSPDSILNSSNTQTAGKIGSHLLLSVSNTENPAAQGTIQKFSLTPKIKDIFFTPLKFSGQIQNNSNFFFKTAGKITITKNQKVIKELPLDSQNILANYYRQFSCEQSSACTLSPPLWPGHYTATLEFDPHLNIPSVTVSFFVLPLSPLALVIFIFLLVIFFRQISPKKISSS